VTAWVVNLPDGMPACTVLPDGSPLAAVLVNSGAIVGSLPNMLAAMSAQESIVASMNAAIPNVLAAIAAQETIGASVAAAMQSPLASIAATESIVGSIAASAPNPSASISATENIVASVAASAPNAQASIVASEFPFSQSDLMGWFRADQLVTLNGSNVSAVGDLSGSGSTWQQGTTGNQPLPIASSINGQPAVRTNVTGSKYLLGTLASQFTGSAITILVVGTVTYAAFGRVMAAYTTGASDTNNVGSFAQYTGSATSISTVRNTAGPSQTVASMSTGLAGVFSVRYDGTNVTSRVTGVDGTVTASTGAFAINHFLFGAGSAGGSVTEYEATFDVCEVAIIGHALSAPELAAWSTYTTARYGLAT
jgi:hypothetical protein